MHATQPKLPADATKQLKQKTLSLSILAKANVKTHATFAFGLGQRMTMPNTTQSKLPADVQMVPMPSIQTDWVKNSKYNISNF